MVIFDSLKRSGCREDTVENIEHYLHEEIKEKKGSRPKFKKSKTRNLLALYPMCPKQDDATSCGVFLLHYAEMILSRLDFVLSG